MADSRFRRILVATDFSTQSQVATRAGLELAKFFQAQSLTYGAVIQSSEAHLDRWFYNKWALEAVKAKAEQSVGRKLYDLPKAPEPTVTFREMRHGVPSHEIMKLSDNADLLVMGTHGRGGVRRFVLGSVAFAALDKTRAVTLLVGDHMQFSRPKDILVAVDFSSRSKRVATTAEDFAAALGARLEMYHAFQGPHQLLDEEDIDPKLLPSDPTAIEQERIKMLRELLPNSRPDLKATVEISSAAPGDAMIAYMNRTKPDLLVLGTQGHSEIFGSTLARAFADAQCPILVVP